MKKIINVSSQGNHREISSEILKRITTGRTALVEGVGVAACYIATKSILAVSNEMQTAGSSLKCEVVSSEFVLLDGRSNSAIVWEVSRRN